MFLHDCLDSDNSEIRLVRFIEPASSTAEIQLELRRASTKDHETHYTTLSYVWGDPTRTAQIFVNGEPFIIGQNLHTGLMQLRQNGVRSWLWIDSICIQQSDVEERISQVNRMGNIFSRADFVYIWLGPGSSETDNVMDFITRVGPRGLAAGVLDLWSNRRLLGEVENYIKARRSSDGVDAESDIAGSELARFMFDLLHEPGLHCVVSSEQYLITGIQELMRRDYWHRVWIIQGVSLSKDAIIMCGTKALQMKLLDAIFTAITFHIREDLRYISPDTWNFMSGLETNFYDNIALNTRREYRGGGQIRPVDIIYKTSEPPGRPFYTASDPRDIVFGVLGIITDGYDLGLSADYKQTMVEVFTATTRALIANGDRGSSSYHLDGCVPRRENPDCLPSWVPDWRELGKHGARILPITSHQDFNATRGMPPPRAPICAEHGQKGLLRRPGCQVDVIIEVMQPPRLMQVDEWSASYINNPKTWLDSIVRFTRLGPDSGVGEDYIWRTVMVDCYGEANRPNSLQPEPMGEETAFLIRRLMRRERIDTETLTERQKIFFRGEDGLAYPQQGLETLEDQITFLEREWPGTVRFADQGRNLFKTAKDMLGLGHVAVQVDDVVTLLWGVKSPIILRPRDASEGGGFTFMGDAYVDGIMRGEFLETQPAERDFEIY